MFSFSYEKTHSSIPIAVVLDKPQVVVTKDGKRTMKARSSGDPLVDQVVYVTPKEDMKRQGYDYRRDPEVERKITSGRNGKGISREDEEYLREHLEDDEDEVAQRWSHKPKKQARLSKLHKSVKAFVKKMHDTLKLPDHLYFFPLPNMDRGAHDCIYLVGRGGSGKSLWVATYVSLWKRLHPGTASRFFLVSEKKEDPSLDHLEPIQLELNEAFVQKWGNMKEDEKMEEADIKKFENSVFVFDDYSAISSKPVQNAIKNLQNKMLHMARQYNIDILITQHQGMQGHKTKAALCDVSKFVFFPWVGGHRQIKNIGRIYADLSKKDLSWILNVGKLSKFSVTVNLTAPQYMISANEIVFTE